MTDGRYQVALELVEQPEPRDIGKHHRRSERVTVRVPDGANLREVGSVLTGELEGHGLIELIGLIGRWVCSASASG